MDFLRILFFGFLAAVALLGLAMLEDRFIEQPAILEKGRVGLPTGNDLRFPGSAAGYEHARSAGNDAWYCPQPEGY